MKKNTFLIGLLAAICTISCQSHKEEKEEERTFLVMNPIEKDTVTTKEYVSQIHSIRHIELRALEKGYLQKINVDEGQRVHQGQTMFQIMPNVYQAEYQKAKAEGNAASIEYENTKLLANNKVVSANELALSKAKYDKAKAEILLAQTHLGFTTVKAPFNGIMDHLHVREGSMVEEGELLTTLSDNSKLWVYFNVPEAEYLNYAMTQSTGKRQQVDLLMANNERFNQKGIVETIEGEFNNETGNIAFRATFPNPNGILRHGETGSVIMTIPLKNALLIPQKASFEVLGKRFVFVIDKNNVVHQREIEVAAELPHLFAIKKGLSTSDRVLIEGIRLVKDNEKVHIKSENASKVFADLNVYAE